MVDGAPADIVARSDELARLRAIVTRGVGPAAAVVGGEPGSGKTTLWQAAVEAARNEGRAVLAATPTQAEQGSPFLALIDLLAGIGPAFIAALPAPRRRALEVALLMADPGAAPPAGPAIGLGLLDVLRRLTGENPLLIAIDDAQWLDPPSADALAIALRRLRNEDVVLLLAVRAGLDKGTGALVEAFAGARLARIELQSLSIGALHYLVERRVGIVMSRPRLRRLHELSAGNPFYAIELARSQAEGVIDLEQPGSLPADLRALLGARLAGLPAATRMTLAASAAMARPRLATLAALERSKDAAGVRRTLEPAIDSDVVRLEGDDIRFAHPMLAAAAYDALGDAERRALHRRLADVPAGDEERARHLAIAVIEPDAATAGAIERAATAAYLRGAMATAADLAGAARRLTPPSKQADRLRRLLSEAEYRFEAGDAPAATALVEGQARSMPAGPERARSLALLARYRHFADDVGEGVALLREALSEVKTDARLRGGIEEGLAWGLLLMRRDLPEAAAHAARAVKDARAVGDLQLEAEALAAQGLTQLAIGRPAARYLEAALALEGATMQLRVLRQPTFACGYWLSSIDEFDRARQAFLTLMERANDHGDESALPPLHNHLALIEILGGSWSAAERHVADGLALAIQNGQLPARAAILARGALLDACRGDVAAARRQADESLAIAGRDTFRPEAPGPALARGGEVAVWAIGLVGLMSGDARSAVRHLVPLATALLEAGIREPGELRSVPDAIEALIGVGDLDNARALLSDWAGIARQTGRPSALAQAARLTGLLRAAEGDPNTGLASLTEAVRAFDQLPLPLGRARARLNLGATYRRAKQKRDARDQLEAAAGEFDRLGARGWRERATAELGRIGGRTTQSGLTETERRIAMLIAEGRSSSQVAAELFVTPKTIETNITRIYHKLGIHSRVELVHRLAELDRGEPSAAARKV